MGCPYRDIESCLDTMMKDSFELYNSQKAGNERLLQKTQRPQDVDPMDFCGVLCDYAEELIEKAKSEAIKEFAEQYEKALLPLLTSSTLEKNEVVYFCLDMLKEMVGDME